MKYMGSKARFSKEILPIILKERTADQWYIEPFAGNGNGFAMPCLKITKINTNKKL